MAGNCGAKLFSGPQMRHRTSASSILRFSIRSMSDNCIFCDIYNGKRDSNVLFRDSDVVVFPDIRPAAEHHYLVVTREHIRNAKELTSDHLPLVEKLIEHGRTILREKGADLSDARFGFHWPPFHSVSHLHLHAISPASSMSYLSKLIFKPDSLWFVQPEYVLKRLTK